MNCIYRTNAVKPNFQYFRWSPKRNVYIVKLPVISGQWAYPYLSLTLSLPMSGCGLVFCVLFMDSNYHQWSQVGVCANAISFNLVAMVVADRHRRHQRQPIHCRRRRESIHFHRRRRRLLLFVWDSIHSFAYLTARDFENTLSIQMNL